MPRSTNKTNKRRSRNNKRQMPDRQLLRDIRDLQSVDVGATLPNVPDVRPVQMSRKTIHQFQRSIQSTTIVNAASPLDTFGAYAFRLSDLPNYTEFTNLFDQYRVTQLEFTFSPTSSGNYSGSLITVLDYDDNAIPGTINQLLEYPTAMISRSGQLIVRRLTPQCALAAYSGTFTSYATKSFQWCDSASPSIFWYGLKWGIYGVTGQPATPQYNVTVRMTVQCRNVD